jgi:hypothetical protein
MARKTWCVTSADAQGEEQSEEVRIDDKIARTAAQVRKHLEQEHKKGRGMHPKIIRVEEGACAPSEK